MIEMINDTINLFEIKTFDAYREYSNAVGGSLSCNRLDRLS